MPILHVKSNTIADFTGTVTVPTSNGGTATAAATDLIRPVDWNSQHGVTFTLGGDTSVQSTAGGTDLRIHGAGGITVAGSTGTLVISGQIGTISSTILAPVNQLIPYGANSFSVSQNTIVIFPCSLVSHVSADHVRMPVAITHSSSAIASAQRGHTWRFGIYSKVNDTQLTQHYSTSYTMAASHSSNASWAISIITAIGNSTSYNTLTASSAGINLSASLHSWRELIMPISSVLSAGEWWWAIHASSSSAGAAGNILNVSNIGMSIHTFNRPGLSTNVSNSAFYPSIAKGDYSTSTAALPVTINFTQIRNFGAQPVFFLATGTV
jgi:hypothetical protein